MNSGRGKISIIYLVFRVHPCIPVYFSKCQLKNTPPPSRQWSNDQGNQQMTPPPSRQLYPYFLAFTEYSELESSSTGTNFLPGCMLSTTRFFCCCPLRCTRLTFSTLSHGLITDCSIRHQYIIGPLIRTRPTRNSA